MKKGLKVSQVASLFNVSIVTIYRKLKKLKNQLKGLTYKDNGTLFLLPEAVEIIKNGIEGNINDTSKPYGQNALSGCLTGCITDVEQVLLKSQISQLEKQLTRKDQELDQKTITISQQDITIKKLIDRQAESETRLQTIIMKLTQDLNEVKQLATATETATGSDKSNSEGKDKDRPEKSPQRASNAVVSIVDYIDRQIEKDKATEQARKDQERLTRKAGDPLTGKSYLQRLYIRLFRPELLRQA